jgi:tRNA(adenine34) deaminase
MEIYTDEYFMKQALKEAQKAMMKDEVPVGAVIVCENKIIVRAHNQTEQLKDTTAHAEIIAISSASSILGTKYLHNCTIFVTLEPCIMCAGALYWSQLDRVVYAAEDPKRGFMKYGKELLHPRTKMAYGILANPCQQIVKDFFSTKRTLNPS